MAVVRATPGSANNVQITETHSFISCKNYYNLVIVEWKLINWGIFQLPYAQQQGTPKPYPSQFTNKWSQGYVRMPCSTQSKIRTEDVSIYNNGNLCIKIFYDNSMNFFNNRKTDERISAGGNWYSRPFCKASSQRRCWKRQFCRTIRVTRSDGTFLLCISFLRRYKVLRFISQLWSKLIIFIIIFPIKQYALEEEAEIFFASLLPKIIQLALQLPTVVTGAIPLLTRHSNATISLSQQQVSCLLANAFLCTFPRRNSTSPQTEFANYPLINFNKWVSNLFFWNFILT